MVPRLAQPVHRFDPAERLFDHLSPVLARYAPLATHRAPINLPCRIRADVAALQRRDALRCLVTLARTHRRTLLTHTAIDHPDHPTRSVACVVSILTIKPLRFSDSACVCSVASLVYSPLLYRLAYGSVVLRFLALLHFSPLKFLSGLRPEARSSCGRAHASLIAPSTLKCSSKTKRCHSARPSMRLEQAGREMLNIVQSQIHARADEPAKQQAAVELLDELARAAAVLFGWNRRAAGVRITFVEQHASCWTRCRRPKHAATQRGYWWARAIPSLRSQTSTLENSLGRAWKIKKNRAGQHQSPSQNPRPEANSGFLASLLSTVAGIIQHSDRECFPKPH